jgi:hypothetical protein
MPTEHAQQALLILRDPGLFQWYVIPLLAVVLLVYATEIQKGCRDVVFAGLAFWGADGINEILNSVFFHLNGIAPLWATPGGTALAGIAWAKMLPADPATRILGIPNRWFIALAGSAFCVLVEILLNRIDALTWDWPWWSARAPWLIFVFGYLWFFLIAFRVHDMQDARRQFRTVAALWGTVALLVLVFGVILRWI